MNVYILVMKYYQEMISYIAPPIVAAFMTGIFSRRTNASGAFIGLIAGLVMAVILLFFREDIFGNTECCKIRLESNPVCHFCIR